MNISELNEQGQPLLVFIVTMCAILTLTVLAWGFIYQVHKYNSLPESERVELRPGLGPGCKTRPVARRVRLYLFLRLIYHGHLRWVWKFGIFFSLVTNGKKGFVKSCSLHTRNPMTAPFVTKKATEFLKKYIDSPLRDDVHCPCSYIVLHLDRRFGFDCSKLETVQ